MIQKQHCSRRAALLLPSIFSNMAFVIIIVRQATFQCITILLYQKLVVILPETTPHLSSTRLHLTLHSRRSAISTQQGCGQLPRRLFLLQNYLVIIGKVYIIFNATFCTNHKYEIFKLGDVFAFLLSRTGRIFCFLQVTIKLNMIFWLTVNNVNNNANCK